MTIRRKITIAITTVFYLLVFMITMVACDTQQGMMHGNSPMGMSNWNSTQILTVLAIGCVIGLLIWKAISKRKK